MPKYIVSQPAITLCIESRSSRSPTTTSAPMSRNACARSSSLRTIARTALPCFNSSSVTVRPTAPTRPAAPVTRMGFAMFLLFIYIESSFLPISRCACRRSVISGFDHLDGIFKCLLQNTSADGPKHEAEHLPLEVLTLAHDDHINVGRTV